MHKNYPHLFAPLKVGNVVFRNRIWGAPTAHAMSFLTPEGFIRHEAIEHFRNRALGGAAVVTLGESVVDNEYAISHYHSLNLYDKKTLPQLTALTDAIHQTGAVASIELSHGGKYALPELIGKNPIAPSACVLPNGVQVDEINEDQMDRIADNFANTTALLQNAGFKMCLLHGAHFWFLGSFLSPIENKRKDKYGGSLENRARFPLMVLDRIRAKVGPGFLLELRLSGREGEVGGFELEDAIAFVKMVQSRVNFVHISNGTRRLLSSRIISKPSCFKPHGSNVFLAEAIKKSGVSIPVITVGNISDPQLAEQILAEGRADIVAMARQLIADPEWPNKVRQGREKEIRPCIKCYNCLDEKNGRVFGGGITSFTLNVVKRYACSVNPLIGIEHNVVPPAERSKNVCVLGGGPAGMQAAITAAERGHRVVLFEKERVLGGQIRFSEHVPFKSTLLGLKEALAHRIAQLGVDVRLNTTATPQMVEEEHPDVIIAALGATPFVPAIPGIDKPLVMPASKAHELAAETGQTVVIIGAGDTGCELAIHLHNMGRQVTLIEQRDFIAKDTGYTLRLALMDEIENKIPYRTHTRCTEITDSGVTVMNGQHQEEHLSADTVILALGSRANESEAECYRFIAPDFYSIGDCIAAKNVRQALRTGYDAAIRL